MALLLCCGEQGFMRYDGAWRQLSCPLSAPELIAVDNGRPAVLDNTEHLLWVGEELFPVDRGVERLLWWQGYLLLLSGETDCLTLMDPQHGEPLFLSPAGVYPQDMCLLPGNAVAVCGGGAGQVLVMRLPEMELLRAIPVPGSAQRVAWLGGWLYILCTAEDDGLCCLLGRADPRSSRWEPLCTLPGLPGALHADGLRLWAAASETLGCFRPGHRKPLRLLNGSGLIRHMTSLDGALLTSDPVLGQLTLLERGRPPQLLCSGDVGQAVWLDD